MFISETIDLLSHLSSAKPAKSDNATLFGRPNSKVMGVVLHATVPEWPLVSEHVAALLPQLRSAHVFRFQNMAVQPSHLTPHASVFPGLDGPHVAAFNSGDYPAPFATCWLEYEMRPGAELGLLVQDGPKGVRVHEFNRLDTAFGPQIHFCCHSVRIARFSMEPDADFARDFPDISREVPSSLHLETEDQLGHFRRYCDWQRHQSSSEGLSEQELAERMAMEAKSAAYLLLCLASNRKTVTTETAKPFANRRRRDKGLHPHPDRHVVALPSDWAPGSLPDLPETTAKSGPPDELPPLAPATDRIPDFLRRT